MVGWYHRYGTEFAAPSVTMASSILRCSLPETKKLHHHQTDDPLREVGSFKSYSIYEKPMIHTCTYGSSVLYKALLLRTGTKDIQRPN